MTRLWIAAGLGVLLVAGCLWETDRSYLGDGDTVPLAVVGTDPTSGAEGVSRTPTLVVRLDQRVQPDTVGADTLRLTRGAGSGTSSVAGLRRVDLLDCTVYFTPTDPLDPDLTHRLEVEGLRAMGGGTLAEPVSVPFVTGDESRSATPVAAPDLDAVWTQVLQPRCSSCHSGTHPPAGLDLSTVETARATLLGTVSPFRPGVPRVAAGRHGSSYLMWKLLGLPGIWGDPMPPPTDSTWPEDRACGTTDPELRSVAAWIDGLASSDATP